MQTIMNQQIRPMTIIIQMTIMDCWVDESIMSKYRLFIGKQLAEANSNFRIDVLDAGEKEQQARTKYNL